MIWSLSRSQARELRSEVCVLLADASALLGGATAGSRPRSGRGQRCGPARPAAIGVGPRRRQLIELLPNMTPAEGKAHLALPGQHFVAAVAINLQDALEPGQMRSVDWPCDPAPRLADRYHSTVDRPGISKELPGLGSPASRMAPALSSRRRTSLPSPSACRAAVRAQVAAGTRRGPTQSARVESDSRLTPWRV